MCCILSCLCNCRRIHRHQIHLLSYGCVSFSLLATGLIFTVFSIVQKDSQVGKVWLAGPVVVVVGLVLLGKVVIDYGPAMSHRKHSFDSEMIDEMALSGQYLFPEQKIPLMSPSPLDRRFSQMNGNATSGPNSLTGKRLSTINRTGEDGAIDCIIYSQYDTVSNSNASSIGAERSPTSPWDHHSSALRPTTKSPPRSPFQNAILNTQIRPLLHMSTRRKDSERPKPQSIQVQPQIHHVQSQKSLSAQTPVSTVPTPTRMSTTTLTNHVVTSSSKGIPSMRLARPSMPLCRPSIWTRHPVVPSASMPVMNKISEVIERPHVESHVLPECHCKLMAVRDYGSTHETTNVARRADMYQGETFVLNDRSFFI